MKVRRLESLYSDLYQDLLTYQNEGTRLNNLFNNIRLPDILAGGGSQLPISLRPNENIES